LAVLYQESFKRQNRNWIAGTSDLTISIIGIQRTDGVPKKKKKKKSSDETSFKCDAAPKLGI
jgi:hypothetical protein